MSTCLKIKTRVLKPHVASYQVQYQIYYIFNYTTKSIIIDNIIRVILKRIYVFFGLFIQYEIVKIQFKFAV